MPEISSDQMRDKMEAHLKDMGEKTAFFNGAYTTIARNQAVDGRGLAQNFALLKQVRFHFLCSIVHWVSNLVFAGAVSMPFLRDEKQAFEGSHSKVGWPVQVQ